MIDGMTTIQTLKDDEREQWEDDFEAIAENEEAQTGPIKKHCRRCNDTRIHEVVIGPDIDIRQDGIMRSLEYALKCQACWYEGYKYHCSFVVKKLT